MSTKQHPGKFDCYANAAAAVRAPSWEGRWQPMDTMPEEGQVIVCWNAKPEYDTIGRAEYLEIMGYGQSPALGWMPLPAPPGSGGRPPKCQQDIIDRFKWAAERMSEAQIDRALREVSMPGSGDGPPPESEAHAFARAVRDHLAQLGPEEIGPMDAGHRHLLMVVGYARKLSDAVLAHLEVR